MASIRLTEQDKINIHIIRVMIPELKTDSAVIKYALNVMGHAYESLEPKLVRTSQYSLRLKKGIE